MGPEHRLTPDQDNIDSDGDGLTDWEEVMGCRNPNEISLQPASSGEDSGGGPGVATNDGILVTSPGIYQLSESLTEATLVRDLAARGERPELGFPNPVATADDLSVLAVERRGEGAFPLLEVWVAEQGTYEVAFAADGFSIDLSAAGTEAVIRAFVHSQMQRRIALMKWRLDEDAPTELLFPFINEEDAFSSGAATSDSATVSAVSGCKSWTESNSVFREQECETLVSNSDGGRWLLPIDSVVDVTDSPISLIGYEVDFIEETFDQRRDPLYWNEHLGVRPIKDIVAASGLLLGDVWESATVSDMSRDGRSIVGVRSIDGIAEQSWLLRIPLPGDADSDGAVAFSDFLKLSSELG